VVRATGDNRLLPNRAAPPNLRFLNTFHWAPGTITVRSGGRVRWRNRIPRELHTITISTRRDLPRSLEGRCRPCEIAGGHLADPNDQNSRIANPVLNAGPAGLDREGDSLVLRPGRSVSATVSAAPGSTLSYVCAVHPWMQGRIRVAGARLAG
jgi:plastocyanin